MSQPVEITCGNHRDEAHRYLVVKHHSVQSVRDCFDPTVETFLCGWMIERTDLVGDDEYGYEPYTRVVDCEALAYATEGGWHCENGHEHLTYGSPAQQAEERIEAAVEEWASRDGSVAGRLDAGETYRQIAGI